MAIDWPLVARIASPVITLFLGAALNRAAERRERIIAHTGHIASFKIDRSREGEEDIWINTHSVIVKNNGKKAASNVRVGHRVLPNFNIFPDIEYRVSELPGGDIEIIFPRLIPSKEVTISYLYYPPLTWEKVNTHIESDEGPAKIVSVLLQVEAATWLKVLVAILMLSGMVSLIYVVVTLIIEIARRTQA